MPKKEDKQFTAVLGKLVDSQLIMAEAIKNINHNSTEVARCQKTLSEVFIQHNTQTTEEHRVFKDVLEKYWKLILIMLGLIAALVGVKLVMPGA